MTFTQSIRFCTAAFALAASCLSAQAAACTAITVLPYSITKGGNYCLTSDLYTPTIAGAAITVTASEVTLDFGGHTIVNYGTNNRTQNIGVLHNGGRGLIVRNGKIRGFLYGVRSTASDVIVRDMTFDAIARSGISLAGPGTALVEHNHIVNSGGPNYWGPLPVIAIEVDTKNAIVRNNTILGITAIPPGSEIGIRVEDGVVQGNIVTDAPVQTVNDDSIGIMLIGSLATGNAIHNFQTCIRGFTSVAEQNVVANCPTDYDLY